MKRYISAVLAATLIVGLAACGGGETQPASVDTPTTSPTSLTVPAVTGMDFPTARTTVLKDYVVTVLGKDGKKWTASSPNKTVMIVSSSPAAGTVIDKAEIQVSVNMTEDEMNAAATAEFAAANAAATAALAAKKLAIRYEFTCGPNPYSTTGVDVYNSLKDVWASKHYAGSDKCITRIDGFSADSKPAVLPSEQAIVDIVAANGGDTSGAPAQAFDTVLRLCVKPDPDFADAVFAIPAWKTARAKAALALCPDAPHAALLQEVATAVKVDSGTKVVGQTMEPGTYKTKPGAKDCYWARTTGGGDIIANNFVGFAPDGVTVTVVAGEGFESSNCGVWTKIG